MKLPKNLLFAPMALVLTLLAGCAGSGMSTEEKRYHQQMRLETQGRCEYERLCTQYREILDLFYAIKDRLETANAEKREQLFEELARCHKAHYQSRWGQRFFYTFLDIPYDLYPITWGHSRLVGEIQYLEKIAYKLQKYDYRDAHVPLFNFAAELRSLASFIESSKEFRQEKMAQRQDAQNKSIVYNTAQTARNSAETARNTSITARALTGRSW